MPDDTLPPEPPPPAPGYLPPPPVHPPPGWGAPPGHPPGPGWAPGYQPHGWAAAGSTGTGRFRALSLGELLDAVFSLYRRNFLLIASISAVVQVPYALISTVLLEATGTFKYTNRSVTFTTTPGQSAPMLTPDQVHQLIGTAVVGGLIGLVVALVVAPLAVAATTRAVSERYLDKQTSLGAAYRTAFARLGAIVWSSLILFLGVVGMSAVFFLVLFGSVQLGSGGILFIVLGFLAFFVAVIVLAIRTSLAVPAIVIEHLSGWRGIVRSWNLTRGFFWRLFGIRLLIGLITNVILGILVALLAVAGSGLDANGQFIVTQVANAFATVFVNPITYIAVTLLYYDTRIRKEAFDIEMLAQSL